MGLVSVTADGEGTQEVGLVAAVVDVAHGVIAIMEVGHSGGREAMLGPSRSR